MLYFVNLVTLLARDPIDFLFEQVGHQQLKSFAERHPKKLTTPQAGIINSFKLNVLADDTPPVVEPAASYEGIACAAASSAAIRTCQIFAEQTCYNPFLSDSVALTIQSTRLQQLGGADFEVHATSVCRRVHCEESACDNPAEPGERERCIPCLRTCNASCMMNVELACLRKVCAATIGAAAATAVAGPTQQGSVAGQTALVQTENAELVSKVMLDKWLRSFVVASTSGDSAPICTDTALKASDTAVIGPGGLTYTAALVDCVANYYTMVKVKSTTKDPNRPAKDSACSVVDKCPRDNAKIAEDRAEKMWNDLAAKYK
jgi:hypothetical protein